jgi:hydrogenase-4 component E
MAERFRTYASLIGFQGLLLFGLAFFELGEMNLANLVFIVTETLLFKAIAVPVLMYRILNRTQVYRVHPDALPGFYSLLLAIGGLLISILMASMLEGKLQEKTFITIALFALITGVILIVTHRRIFSHMVGFLVIENSVFLFSLAVGSETPYLVNIGVLLDIVVSVLILSVFIGKIGSKFSDMETESLTDLKH